MPSREGPMREERSGGNSVSYRSAFDRRNPLYWLIVVCVLLIASIVVGTAITVLNFRERALNNRERELENTVLLLSRHFDRQLHDFEAVQNDVVRRIERSGVASPEEFRRQVSGERFRANLTGLADGLSEVAGIHVFDANGQLINSSQSWPVAAVNIADHSYFRDFAADDRSPRVRLAPVNSRYTAGWTTVIARKVVGPNGQFLGVVSRDISPANLESFFESVVLGTGSAISMFDREGTMLARYPHIESMIGRNFRTGPIHQSLSRVDHATQRVISPVDGEDR